jgi:outer membrane protein assembly factor BamA
MRMHCAHTWTPTDIYSAEQFAKSNRISANDIFSQQGLEDIESRILDAYNRQGYIYAYLAQNATFDEVAGTVSIALRAVPADAYRLKSINIQGLSPVARQTFDADWKLAPGDIYDGTYFLAFMGRCIAKPGPLYQLGATIDLQPNAQDHNIDLTITFLPPPRIR